MDLKTLWVTLTPDERRGLADRSGLTFKFLRQLGPHHKTSCSVRTIKALADAEPRLTRHELVEEFAEPKRPE